MRLVRAVGNRRVLTVGVDRGAAAGVLPSCRFQDYPPELEPSCLSRVIGGYWVASGVQTRRLMGSIDGVRKGLPACAVGVTKDLLSVAGMDDQGHVVLFSKTRSFACHPSDKVANEPARRNNVYELEM